MADIQTNVATNPARYLVFFEGNELAFNYKTNQWSRVPAYDGLGLYSINSKTQDIGTVRLSSGSVDFQEQADSDVAQDATIATGAVDLNPGGRSVVTGIRPIINGGTVTVQAGCQDSPTDSTIWSDAATPSTRTDYANFRKEGRYMSAQINVTGGFNQLFAADVEFTPAGDV